MKRRRIYEGKAKDLFEGPEAGTLIQYFKDDTAANKGKTSGVIVGKGVINNRISEFLFTRLGEMGVPHHLVRRVNMREQLIRAAEIIPVHIVVRNLAAGSFAQRFGRPEGEALPRSIVEFFIKDEKIGYPLVTHEHITAFNFAAPDELEEMFHQSLRINDYLSGLFFGVGLRLVDIRLEFGRLYDDMGSYLVLTDEISPDTMRLWDIKTNEKYDKDRFRLKLDRIAEGYQEVARRLGILPEMLPQDANSPAPGDAALEAEGEAPGAGKRPSFRFWKR